MKIDKLSRGEAGRRTEEPAEGHLGEFFDDLIRRERAHQEEDEPFVANWSI